MLKVCKTACVCVCDFGIRMRVYQFHTVHHLIGLRPLKNPLCNYVPGPQGGAVYSVRELDAAAEVGNHEPKYQCGNADEL